MNAQKKALFSLFDTTHADHFAKVLIDHGWEIIASNRTGIFLQEHNIPITKLADFVGFHEHYSFSPTLHPKIEFNLTMDEAGKDRLDLVYIVNYPITQGNDVGGHTVLGLAAKGKRIPVCTMKDMEKVVGQIAKNGDITPKFRKQLIDRANTKISNHYAKLTRLK